VAAGAGEAGDDEAEGRGVKKNRAPACRGCGGPHPFDTSVPSHLWNEVIRGHKLPDYLCPACIIAEFARRGVSFSATLWGKYKGRWFHGVPIEVRVGGRAAKVRRQLEEENNDLRASLSSIYDKAATTLHIVTRPRRRRRTTQK
jgi:hypothetical protein